MSASVPLSRKRPRLRERARVRAGTFAQSMNNVAQFAGKESRPLTLSLSRAAGEGNRASSRWRPLAQAGAIAASASAAQQSLKNECPSPLTSERGWAAVRVRTSNGASQTLRSLPRNHAPSPARREMAIELRLVGDLSHRPARLRPAPGAPCFPSDGRAQRLEAAPRVAANKKPGGLRRAFH
jgi:hypothetical protein